MDNLTESERPVQRRAERLARLSPADRAALEKQIRLRREAGTAHIGRREARDAAPLSFAQELLWLLDRSTPGVTAYNVSVVLRLSGTLDRDALTRALGALVERHDVFRTRFTMRGKEPVAEIVPGAPVAVEEVDLTAFGGGAFAEAERLTRDRHAVPFDLESDQLLRVTLFALAPGEYILVALTHHIVFDGWSTDLFARDLAALYAAFSQGTDARLPALSVTYGDFAAWQRTSLTGDRLERLLVHWRERLKGASVLELPTDKPRTQVRDFAGAQELHVISGDAERALRAFARERGATLYTVLLAAYAAVLRRYSGQTDVVIGSPVAARTRIETEDLIGYFSNLLPLRVDCAGDPTFAELLARVRETSLVALEHQDLPFEKLVMDLRESDATDTALFRCLLTMEDAQSRSTLRAGALDVETVDFDSPLAGWSKFDLVLLVSESSDGLRLLLQYRTDLYQRETIARLLGHLSTVLDAVIADPARPLSHLPLLTAGERADLARWNATAVNEPYRSVLELFEETVARTPARTALVCADDRASYAELDARATALAKRLGARGIGRGGRVAIGLDRSAEAIVALLGVLKSGAAYVPVPPELPPARVAEIVAQSAPSAIVTNAAGEAAFGGCATAIVRIDHGDDAGTAGKHEASPGDVAYILFTSGSTGTPKGVAVTHGNIANYVRGILARLGRDDVRARSFATVTTLGADLGNTAIFGALCSGGTLHVIGREVSTETARFAAYLAEHRIDVLKITPSHLAALGAGSQNTAQLLPAQWLVCGGEALSWTLADALAGPAGPRVMNHYGPTEATVGAATYTVGVRDDRSRSATVPIGLPLANLTLHVVDAENVVLPVGIPGELLIAGAGVAQGYVGREDLTVERFVTLPDIGRAYRTGDRVRRLASGDIEFLGRVDRQVKVRGYRVELPEIEETLRRDPRIAGAAVILGNDRQPVAFVVPARGAEGLDPAHLRASLGEQLPDYMIPAAIVLLSALPLTANGKVDLAALAEREIPAVAAPYVAPRTEVEETVASLFASVLKKERVSVTDDFFALGGDSLLAIRVLGKLSGAFGIRLTLGSVFEAPTVEQLAGRITLELELSALENMSDEEAAQLAGDESVAP